MSELTAGNPAIDTVALASEVLGRAASAISVILWARFIASLL